MVFIGAAQIKLRCPRRSPARSLANRIFIMDSLTRYRSLLGSSPPKEETRHGKLLAQLKPKYMLTLTGMSVSAEFAIVSTSVLLLATGSFHSDFIRFPFRSVSTRHA